MDIDIQALTPVIVSIALADAQDQPGELRETIECLANQIAVILAKHERVVAHAASYRNGLAMTETYLENSR